MHVFDVFSTSNDRLNDVYAIENAKKLNEITVEYSAKHD